MSNEGYVYVLTNPSIPNKIKIGRTSDDPHRRAKVLSKNTGVPENYEVAYQLFFQNCIEAEKRTHQYFAHRRPNQSREFFEVSVDDAKLFLTKLKDEEDRFIEKRKQSSLINHQPQQDLNPALKNFAPTSSNYFSTPKSSDTTSKTSLWMYAFGGILSFFALGVFALGILRSPQIKQYFPQANNIENLTISSINTIQSSFKNIPSISLIEATPTSSSLENTIKSTLIPTNTQILAKEQSTMTPSLPTAASATPQRTSTSTPTRTTPQKTQLVATQTSRPTTQSNPNAVVTETPKPTFTAVKPTNSAPQANNSRTVEQNGITISILEARTQPHDAKNLSFFARCNNNCVALVLKIHVANINRTPLLNASPLSFELRSAGGAVHSKLPFVVDHSESFIGGFLYPSDKQTGVISFGVPASVKTFTLTYRDISTTLNLPVQVQ